MIKSKNNFKIRDAKMDDVNSIANIHFSAWQTVYRGQIPDYYLDSLQLEEYVKRWRSFLNKSSHHTLIFESHNSVLGFLYYGPCEDPELQKINCAEIICIYFDSQARRKGYGESLYREAEKRIQSVNYDHICIKVLASNLSACLFYEKLGFTLEKIYENKQKLSGGRLHPEKDLSVMEKRYLKKIK